MFDHDKAIEAAWKKAKRIEKEMEAKRKKQRRVFAVTSIIAVACVLGLIGWRSVNRLKPDNTDSGKNTTHITKQPTESIPNPQQNQPTSVPTHLPGTVVEIERPSNIYVVDKDETAVWCEEINAGLGEIEIWSQSLQRVLDKTGDEKIYYPVEIRFCFPNEVTQDRRKILTDGEVLRIREQGIYVEKENEEGIDVLINKEQLEGLKPSDVCGYLLGWTR